MPSSIDKVAELWDVLRGKRPKLVDDESMEGGMSLPPELEAPSPEGAGMVPLRSVHGESTFAPRNASFPEDNGDIDDPSDFSDLLIRNRTPSMDFKKGYLDGPDEMSDEEYASLGNPGVVQPDPEFDRPPIMDFGSREDIQTPMTVGRYINDFPPVASMGPDELDEFIIQLQGRRDQLAKIR